MGVFKLIAMQEFELSAEQLTWLLSGRDVIGHEELQYQSAL